MKSILTFLLLGVLTIARGAGPDLSTNLSLDGDWRFAIASDESAAQSLNGFQKEGFDAKAFRPIPVPSNWVMQGFEEPHFVNGTKSEGFYLHSFPVPAELKGKRTLLRFGGVWQSAEVWLNDTLLGRHDSGFTGFAFDATDALKPGETNRLAVRVRQQTPNYKLDANDDWALPGIYRGVWLETSPKEWNLENVEVVTDLDDQFRDATLKVRAFVMRNEKGDYASVSQPFEVRAILSREGREIGRTSETQKIVSAHNGSDVPLELKVSAPALWTAETPALYDLRVELSLNGTVQHAWEDRIGFREVDTVGGVFRINGQSVKLRGVARHDQHPDVGRATRREHWLEDIQLMKAANINAVRTAHYPPAEGFVRLCDEMGIYVIEEIPYGFGGDRMSDPSYAEGAFLRVYETINRDRNRPSIVVWSVGNEDPFSALHLATLKAVKGLDPTRPTLMPFRADETLPPEVDILAPHYWTAADYDALAAKAKRPIITTEYSHAMGPDDFGGLADRWNSLTRHPAGAGAIIWAWADQGLRRPINGRPVLDPMKDKTKYTREGSELVRESDAGKNEIYDAHGNLGTDGIINADRTPQNAYWETKAVYSPVRVLTDRVDFTPGQAEVVIPIRNDYDFTDLSTVTAKWTLFHDANVLAQGAVALKGVPHKETSFKLPINGIPAGAIGAYYTHVVFMDPAKNEITRHAVQLGYGSTLFVRPIEVKPPSAETKDGSVRISAGTSIYSFDPKRGMISAVEIDGKPFANGSDLLVWRDPTYCERQFLDKRSQTYDWETYLQGMPASASAWNVAESADGVTLTSTVTFKADEKNQVTADFTYRVAPNGGLTIDYVVRPSVDVDWLLDLGIGLKLVDQPMTAEWLGWGPGTSLENRHESTLFGQWTIPVFSAEARNTRSGVEWLKVNLPEGRAMLVSGLTAFRFDGGKGEKDGGMLRMLNKTAGASVKGGIPEREEWKISLKDGKGEFRGKLELQGMTLLAPRMPAHPAVVSTEIINENAPYPESHASTIVEIAPGQLAAAWFGGTKERNPDVGIWFARQENGKWQPAVEVANGIQSDGSPRLPTWNPVLFAPKDAPLQLFYKVGPHPSTWWGMVITSTDGGNTWSKPVRLPNGILGPIKNKPVLLSDGSWLSPSSTEGTDDGWVAHFERSTDQGKTWTPTAPVAKSRFDWQMIQPSILFHPEGKLQAIGRTRNGVTASTWSTDQGLTWSPLTALAVPNTNSGTDAVTLADGRHLLVFNDTAPPPERPNKGVRYPLNVAISKDGIAWTTVLTLDLAPCAAGYAYPAVIQAADGKVHITYTFNRQTIKHVVLDPAKF